MELYWCAVLGIITFQLQTCSGGNEDTNHFHNHRRNRILLMKDEVFNFPSTSDEPITKNQLTATAGQETTKRDKGSIEDDAAIATKRYVAKTGKHRHLKERSSTQNSKRKLGTMKEVIPSIMFSHNGTYKYGASPKVVHNATIKYKTTQGKKFKINSKKEKVLNSNSRKLPVIAAQNRKMVTVGQKRQLPYFPPINVTTAIGSKRQFPYFPPFSQITKAADKSNQRQHFVKIETIAHLISQKRKINSNLIL